MVRQAWFLAVNSWLRGWPRQRLEVPLPLLQGANHTSISVVPIELVVIQCFIFSERRRHLPHPVLPDARHHRHPHLPPRAPGWTPFRFQNPLIIPLIRIVILTTFDQIDLIDEIEQVRRYLLLFILIDQIGQYSAMGPAVVYKHISPVFKVFNHFQLDY